MSTPAKEPSAGRDVAPASRSARAGSPGSGPRPGPSPNGQQSWKDKAWTWAKTTVEKRTSRHRAAVKVLRDATLEAQRSRLPQMAAALSYRTVFGLLPMIVVALVALRFFISDAQIDHFVNRALSYAGLEAIVVKPPPDAPPGDAPAVRSTQTRPRVGSQDDRAAGELAPEG